MNAMLEAMKSVGLVKPESKPLTEQELAQQKMDVINQYCATHDDIIKFNDLNPSDNFGSKSFLHRDIKSNISLVSINSYQLFNILGYNIKQEMSGVILSQGSSFMTLKSFNELATKAKNVNRKFSVTFELQPKFIKLNIIDLDELNPVNKSLLREVI